MKKALLKGIVVFVLLSALILASCEDANITNRVGNPKVTSRQVTGGLVLSWPPVKDAQSYQVWRTLGKGTPINLGYVTEANNDGIFECWDIVSLTNNLAANTEYTYTVYSIATAGIEDLGKWEKKVKTGDFPAQGSAAAAPTIDLQIDFAARSFTITVTPPASGNIPNGYFLQLGTTRNGPWQGVQKSFKPNSPIVWTEIADQWGTDLQRDAYNVLGGTDDSPDGDYTAQVFADISDKYFKTTTVEVMKTVDPLFSGYFSASNASIDYTSDKYNASYELTAKAAITGFYIPLNLYQFTPQDGVTYTVERATVDKDGKEGTYQPITVYSRDAVYNSTTSDWDVTYTQTDFTPDVLGHLKSNLCDKGLQVKKETYVYRLKAVKAGITDYQKSSKIVFDPYDYINLELDVSRTTNYDATDPSKRVSYTFKFTPYLDRTGVLQSGDKVVLYSKTINTSNTSIMTLYKLWIKPFKFNSCVFC